MADAPTALDFAGIAGGLASVGAGFKWLFGRADRREKALDAREIVAMDKLEARIIDLEKRDSERESAMSDMRDEISLMRTVILMFSEEVAGSNPNSPALAVARHLLRDRFPLPADMTETLKRMG